VCNPRPQTLPLVCEENLRFLLPYLWPDQKFDSLSMIIAADAVALNISYEGLLLTVLLKIMKRLLIVRNTPNSRIEG